MHPVWISVVSNYTRNQKSHPVGMVMQFKNAEKGSLRESTAATELARTILHRRHLDDSVKLIGEILFAGENSVEKLTAVRPAGSVVVDDWACLKSMVRMLHIACPKLLLSSAGFLLVSTLLCSNM